MEETYLLHAAAVSGNEELVHMLVEDYALEPGVSHYCDCLAEEKQHGAFPISCAGNL